MTRPAGAAPSTAPALLLLPALPLLLLAACDPIERDTGQPLVGADGSSDDDDEGIDTSNLTSGLLSDSGWRLSFRTTSLWSGGNCFELQLTNDQADATWWQARLTPSAPLEDLGDVSENMLVTWDGTVVNVAPWGDSAVARGESVTWAHCTEPGAAITDFEIFAVYEDFGDDPSEDPDEGEVYGAVVDETGTVALSWQTEVIEGRACLDLDVINLSDSLLSDWELTATFADETELDVAEDLIFLPQDARTLRILPETGDTSIAAHGHESAVLCIDPYTPFESVSLTLPEEPVDTGDTGEPGDPGILKGFLLDSEHGIGLTYTEVGTDGAGACLDLRFSNLGSVPFNDWTASLEFASAATVTSADKLFPTGSTTSTIGLSPLDGIQIIPAYSTVQGQLCLTPRQGPVSFDIDGVREAP